ncbi:MAG: VTT domain-containing protein [Candidatus Zixiibacteriota bacterium]
MPPRLSISTMEQSLELINQFLDRLFAYGPFWIYLTLFLALFIENIFPPFPGDFFTLAGGALAAAGRLNIFLVFLLVYLGGILSILLLYQLGYSYGRDFFIRKNFRYFNTADIDRLEIWFRKRGAWLLILNRFIVGARAVIAVVSGIGRYDRTKMILFISLSFFIFNGILLFGSYIFVVNFDTIAEYYRVYEKTVWPIIFALLITFILFKIVRTKKNEK